jgi:hypothetical protein
MKKSNVYQKLLKLANQHNPRRYCQGIHITNTGATFTNGYILISTPQLTRPEPTFATIEGENPLSVDGYPNTEHFFAKFDALSSLPAFSEFLALVQAIKKTKVPRNRLLVSLDPVRASLNETLGFDPDLINQILSIFQPTTLKYHADEHMLYFFDEETGERAVMTGVKND